MGTGLPEFNEFPCDVDGLKFFPNDSTSPNCQLYYGYNGAPTKIEITNFDTSPNIRNLYVWTPLIKNPTAHIVPNIWFEI